MGTGQNGDKSKTATTKRRHIQNGDNQNGDSQNGDMPKTATHPKRRQTKRRHAKTCIRYNA